MLAEVLLIAGKDLRIERRSKVAINQVVPFAILIVVLFGFALNFFTPVGYHFIKRVIAGHTSHGGFCHQTQRGFDVAKLKEKLYRILNNELNDPLNLGNV